MDLNFPLRRAIDVTWDAERSNGEDLAYTEFYTAGRHDPTGRDVRVATEDGKPVAADVLQVGPGDRVCIAFALQKGVKKYYVYWGNPDPPESKLELQYRRGMLLESKPLSVGVVDNSKQLRDAFDKTKETIGRTMVDRPFIGNNLLGDRQMTVSKLSGQLFVPIDGEYQFALSADDRAAAFLDDKLLIFAPGAAGDIRYNHKLNLTRGPHALVIYHADLGGDWSLSLGWKRPDSAKIDIVGRDALGYPFPGQPGALEERNKTLVADFAAEYQGESWYADRISHRYRFNGAAIKPAGMKFEWDFGDGQTGSGAKVEHVYLSDGVYPVKLTAHLGGNQDTRTSRFVVQRDLANLAKPNTDALDVQSKIVSSYDLDVMTPTALVRTVFLHHRAENWDAMIIAAEKLASQKKQPDGEGSFGALTEVADTLMNRGGAAAVEKLWAIVPSESNLSARASRQRAQVLMWGLADFAKTAQLLRDVPEKDTAGRRLLAMAMVLSGAVEDGAKILRELPEQGDPDKRAAISGAMARTIEFFIDEKDANAGDDQWERWQSRYPADFLLGYSVLLKVKLIETHKNPLAAAKLAEAFAQAVPKSSYAPQLLHRASNLTEKTDAKKAADLRSLLKQRYPEDPLAQ